LGILTFEKKHFTCAAIPTYRLPVHLRRLVDAGYKCGVIRQTETAAVKKAGDNKSGPFERELTGMFTKATMVGEGMLILHVNY
jgi:DNA mismatch repair protein MSH3